MDTLLKLKLLLDYVDKNVPYYHNLFCKENIDISQIDSWCAWERIPFLNKNDVQKNSNLLISGEANRYPMNADMDIRRTSGSTGDCLRVCWNSSDNRRSMLPLWRIRQKYYGISPDMPYCSFYSANYIGNKIFDQEQEITDAQGHHLAFSKVGLTEDRLYECYRRILKFQPRWLSLQPSIALLFADLIIRYNLPIPTSLRYIELNGELLTAESRRAIQDAFNVAIADMYGCVEVNTISIEVPGEGYRILKENVFVEVIKDNTTVEGQEGDICVTSFHNHAMPFIRYFPGDRGIITTDSYGVKHLHLSNGRASDYVVLRNGQKLNSYVLAGIIQYTNEYMEGAICQYQIVQSAFNAFSVTFVLKPAYKGWGASVIRAFKENIHDPQLLAASWEFHVADSIYPDPRTGKVKSFIPLSLQAYRGGVSND